MLISLYHMLLGVLGLVQLVSSLQQHEIHLHHQKHNSQFELFHWHQHNCKFPELFHQQFLFLALLHVEFGSHNCIVPNHLEHDVGCYWDHQWGLESHNEPQDQLQDQPLQLLGQYKVIYKAAKRDYFIKIMFVTYFHGRSEGGTFMCISDPEECIWFL